ncbi:PREDICTED: 60S acidic ribosomal protein P1-like, partial [Rhagoletis zephyria]|uniref:60S acidic ribosomal protein P1-like n=1 Tax=Rhagoletis zephyria TaxID=28612 RepID=UPI0008113C9C
ELTCICAALTLVDERVAVACEKITTILKAALVEVEPYWHGLFAKALAGICVGSAALAEDAAPAGGDRSSAKAKNEEESEESDKDMGFSLFG